MSSIAVGMAHGRPVNDHPLGTCSFIVIWTTLHMEQPDLVKFPEIKVALDIVVSAGAAPITMIHHACMSA